jgi:hypothetical protein
MPILSGTWCDVTRRGQVVRTVGASVWVEDVAIPAPDTLMFLRADEDFAGHLVIVGKAHGDGRGWLWREAGQTWVDLGMTYGNHCVETDGTRVYVQRTLTSYDVIDLNPGGTSYSVTCPATSQGFCDVTSPLGIMSDDVRSAIPGIYRPQAAGPYFVGGARETTDVLAVPQGPARLVAANVAPVEEVRAAWVNGEVVCCAYVAAGVWTWRGTPTEMPPPETWTPSPAGTLVSDTWRFVVGASPTGWVRTGPNDERMDCYRDGESVYFVKFGNPSSYEQWGRDAEGNTWHLCDHSGTGGNAARGEAYQWSSGLWLTDECHVGDVIDNSRNAIRWYRDGRWQDWAPYPFRVTLDSHARSSQGRERLSWSYRYGPAFSVREVYTGDSDLGWWSWTLHEGGQTHGGEWRTPVQATPLDPQGVRVKWPDVRPIVIAEPEKPPVPVNFPPRNDSLDFLNQLDAYYRDALARPLADPHYVDMEGEAVWLQEYLRLRVNGATHDQAVAGVKRQIDTIVHPPDVTSGLVGRLGIADA